MQNDEIVPHMIDLQLDRLLAIGEKNDELLLGTIRQDSGSWLALRRAVRGLSDAVVTERTRLTQFQIRSLELGLFASARDVVPEGAWQVLAVLLENEQHDFARVSAIIRLALGYAQAADAQELPRVAADLAALEQEPRLEVLQVLIALHKGAVTALAVQDEIKERTRQDPISLATIAWVLAYLDQRNLATLEKAPSSAVSQQPIFRLTPEGQEAANVAFQVEKLRLELEKELELKEEHLERAEQQQRRYYEAKQRLILTLQP